jgi:hypothetical protein
MYVNTFSNIISWILYQFQLCNICLQVIWSLFCKLTLDVYNTNQQNPFQNDKRTSPPKKHKGKKVDMNQGSKSTMEMQVRKQHYPN